MRRPKRQRRASAFCNCPLEATPKPATPKPVGPCQATAELAKANSNCAGEQSIKHQIERCRSLIASFPSEHLKSVARKCIQELRLPAEYTTDEPCKLLQCIVDDDEIPERLRNGVLMCTRLYIESCEKLKACRRMQNCLTECGRSGGCFSSAFWKKFATANDDAFMSSQQMLEIGRSMQQIANEFFMKKQSASDLVKVEKSSPKRRASLACVDEDFASNSSESDPICICRYPSSGIMIACDNPGCPIEWYHVVCVKQGRVPRGQWICGFCRLANFTCGNETYANHEDVSDDSASNHERSSSSF